MVRIVSPCNEGWRLHLQVHPMGLARYNFTRQYIIGTAIIAEMIVNQSEYHSCVHKLNTLAIHLWLFPDKEHLDYFLANDIRWLTCRYVFVCCANIADALNWMNAYK